jgi:hypothetical protein
MIMRMGAMMVFMVVMNLNGLVVIMGMAVLVFSVQGGLLVLARGLSWPAGNRTNAAALLVLQYIGEFPFRSLLYHLTFCAAVF